MKCDSDGRFVFDDSARGCGFGLWRDSPLAVPQRYGCVYRASITRIASAAAEARFADVPQRRAISYLRDRGDMAILPVEQCFDFARALADRFAVMDRGEIVLSGTREEMVEEDVRRRLTV